MNQRIKVLELFAGSSSLGREARRLDMDVFSVDIRPFKNISLVADIETLQADDIPWVPDIIWASPPCDTYSLLAVGHHRNEDGTPATEFAAKSDRLIRHTIELIKAFPNAIWYIENPRATLRKMPFMQSLPDPVTVWYCRYNDKRAKPTDIWTNNLRSLFNDNGWAPRPECWNGNKGCHHEKVKSGGRGGTVGLKNDYERSKIPADLCREVLLSAVSMAARPALVSGIKPFDPTLTTRTSYSISDMMKATAAGSFDAPSPTTAEGLLDLFEQIADEV